MRLTIVFSIKNFSTLYSIPFKNFCPVRMTLSHKKSFQNLYLLFNIHVAFTILVDTVNEKTIKFSCLKRFSNFNNSEC